MLHLFAISLLIEKCLTTTYCNNEYACASSVVNDDEVFCNGFSSCIDIQTILTEADTYQYGSYSAYLAAYVISGDDTLCYGDSSCRNINHFQTNDHTYCYGYRSCFESTFERTSTTNSYSSIHFDGDESGAYTTLNLSKHKNVCQGQIVSI